MSYRMILACLLLTPPIPLPELHSLTRTTVSPTLSLHPLNCFFTHSLDQEDGQEVLIKFGAVTPVLVRLDSKSGLRPSIAVPAPVPVPAQTPGNTSIILLLNPVLSTLLCTIVTTVRLSVSDHCRYMQRDTMTSRLILSMSSPLSPIMTSLFLSNV